MQASDLTNLQYADAGNVTINMNVAGIGPYTYHPNDLASVAQQIKVLLNQNTYTIAAYVAPPAPVPQIISDRQFYQQLADQGIITQNDALAAVRTGTLPSNLVTLVSALPANQQFNAEMLLSGATQFQRNHPLTATLGTAFGWTSSQIDAFWIAASLL